MLYHLLYPFHSHGGIFNLIGYQSFRAMAGFLFCLALVLYLQPKFIAWFRKHQLGQPIREDGPQTHLGKKGTPTMGGLVVVTAVVITTFLFSRLDNLYIWVALFLTLSYAGIGFADDYLKVSKKNTKGVSARAKLGYQFLAAFAALLILKLFSSSFTTAIAVPFFKEVSIDPGWWFVPFGALVIVGCSNAVNLTDGLDGLVSGPVMTVAFAYGVIAYVSGNALHATYLQIDHLEGCGELAIFCAAIIAGGLGFLWFNTFPAQVFMGDVGSLALGGALGIVAIETKQELLLLIAGGVFVLEALSVIAQVASFKLTGKRVLKMAPLHHHFELEGMAEPKIIVRCWIISIVLAVLSIATLKLR